MDRLRALLKRTAALAEQYLPKLWPLVAIALIALAFGVIKGGHASKEAPKNAESFTALRHKVNKGKIAELEVIPTRNALIVTEKNDQVAKYEVGFPVDSGSSGLEGLLKRADAKGVTIISQPTPKNGTSIFDILLQVLPLLLVAAILATVLLSGGMLGRRAAIEPSESGVTFDDVAGIGEAVQELSEVRNFLEDPQRFEAIGARVPKGVLLYGPPGTGKTMLARAVASEAGVRFFACSGSEFVEMYAGLGARRVRALFKQAKRHAPSIVFIDELDAVGQKRGAGGGGGGDREADQTLVEVLRQMDGFRAGREPSAGDKILNKLFPKREVKEQHPVIVIGATNRLESLDSALTRPGRFDRHIAIDPPDRRGRAEILRVHARSKKLRREVDLDLWAAKTAGMTGADLSLLLNEAALNAVRDKRKVISEADLDHAFLRLVAGAEKQHRTLSEAERERIAYHEAGHAIVREHLKDSNIVHKISIIPRGRSGGQTIHVSEEDVFLFPVSKLRDTLATLLGGRAAEDLALGEVSSGAADDLEKASELAEKMFGKLGMSKTLGLRVDLENVEMSERQRQDLDSEIKEVLDEDYLRARTILADHRREMDAVVQTLLEEETIDRDRFLEILAWD